VNRASRAILLVVLLVSPCAAAPTRRGSPAPARDRNHAELVLSSADGGERSVGVGDLAFAYFKRSFYRKAAPRAQEPGGQRLEISDKRRECRCLRLEDWTKIKFLRLRQIEILYPADAGEARLRLTYRGGRLQDVPASALYGSQREIRPRFMPPVAASIREFPLLLPDAPKARWPEESLLRIVFVQP